MNARPLTVIDLGLLPYAEAWALQKARVNAVADGREPDTLYMVEHEPVITVGRGTRTGQAPQVDDIPVREIERGGSATYHGPGQLVGYPILRLAQGDRDVHRYLRDLEEVLIRALTDLGLEGGRKAGITGVWVGDRKVASLGVAVRRWTTYHGFALNCDVDLAPFRRFQPCGLDGAVYTSITELLGRRVGVAEVKSLVVRRFGEVFGEPG